MLGMKNTRGLLFSLLLTAIVAGVAVCADGPDTPQPLPDDAQLVQAQERGKKIRALNIFAPEALLKYAAVFKIKGVRCGHESFGLEDARGEGGGVYRCTERFKLCIPQNKVESVEYTHQLLLNADFSLLSGKQICSSVAIVDLLPRNETIITEMLIAGDTLELARREKIGADAEKIQPPQQTRLLGLRPIPGKAVLALAALARRESAVIGGGGIQPFMATTIYMGWSNQAFNIQSAWLAFERGGGGALRMSARYLDGELSDKGLMVEAPTDENWKNAAVWGFDDKMRVTRLPAASEQLMSVELADPDTIDFDAPLDREKIAAALKAALQENNAPANSTQIHAPPLPFNDK